MKHIDLFSGIGGFSLAVDRVWHEENNEHIFVERDKFCTAVLKNHWPDATYYGDIADLVADTNRLRERARPGEVQEAHGEVPQRYNHAKLSNTNCFILTGGFPCQPFSHAGRRRGTDDDRYLWPAMLDCITLFRPRWVIAENVSGLATWNDGLVFETVCSDMEKEGYTVQPFRIPACAVGAPHRRDRWWFVASRTQGFDSDSIDKRLQRGTSRKISTENRQETVVLDTIRYEGGGSQWQQNWIEVATRLCRVDDGVPRRMDRNPRLKALGNAIVPQVAEEIMRAIRLVDETRA